MDEPTQRLAFCRFEQSSDRLDVDGAVFFEQPAIADLGGTMKDEIDPFDGLAD